MLEAGLLKPALVQKLMQELAPLTLFTFQPLRSWLKAVASWNLTSERATRGASVSVSASGRASARRARSVPTLLP